MKNDNLVPVAPRDEPFEDLMIPRQIVELPSRAVPSRAVFEDLGIVFSAIKNPTSQAVSAQLPTGWEFKRNEGPSKDYICGWLIDPSGELKGEILDKQLEESELRIYELRLLPDCSFQLDIDSYNAKFAI
mgnify:CR=1 FL=1